MPYANPARRRRHVPLSVLVANEPRAYRDALAGALAALRPDLRVELLSPDVLDAALDRPRPPVVVRSRLTPLVEERACAWIVLYPEHESFAVMRGADGGRVVPNPDLGDILHAVRTAAGTCGAEAPADAVATPS